MRWGNNKKARSSKEIWKLWFAWRPVRLKNSGGWVWLENVMARKFRNTFWEYEAMGTLSETEKKNNDPNYDVARDMIIVRQPPPLIPSEIPGIKRIER